MSQAVITPEEQTEFEERLGKAREREEAIPVPTVDGKPVAWGPQEGSQVRFLSCPLFEVLFHGTRGPGKTDALLMDYAQHVDQGHGAAWRGIIFRQTYPQLADVVAKSEKWFRRIFPGATFNRGAMRWEWPTGEVLLFRHMNRPDDYWNYHGHEYPFIGFEELTNWADEECYVRMISCCRSSERGVPRKLRATTNPYGPGHNWVKDRFKLAGQWWKTIFQERPVDRKGKAQRPRAAIHGHISENRILLDADPDYPSTIVASAANDAMVEAWLNGSWDITAGGMFDDVWTPKNVVPAFEVPPSWYIDRSFDWGSSRPFSVAWWAQSDGSDLVMPNGNVYATVRGDLFRIYEWYGFTGKPNEGLRMLAVDIAEGIVERELMWGLRTKAQTRVGVGVADSAIFSVENGVSIAADMAKPVRIDGHIYAGVQWAPSDKRPGSRKSGWEMVRKMVKAANPKDATPREDPALFVVGDRCEQFLRTFPSLPRDEKDLDDVDTDAEDHIGDEVRYRVRASGAGMTSGRHTGMY